MRRLGWALNLGLVITGIAALGQGAVAGSSDTSRTITIQVHNYAVVDKKTLLEAEKVATTIFRNAGVESQWTDAALASQPGQDNATEQESCELSHLRVNILPRPMANYVLRGDVTGFAPGDEPDRQLVYVLYDKVQDLAGRLALIGRTGNQATNQAQILGHVIAHEIGHVLLNLIGHSKTGIMRGNWDLRDLQQASHGYLLFTAAQAETIRSEVARRTNVQGNPKGEQTEVASEEKVR
jgi:hypothetical protein